MKNHPEVTNECQNCKFTVESWMSGHIIWDLKDEELEFCGGRSGCSRGDVVLLLWRLFFQKTVALSLEEWLKIWKMGE